MMEDDLKLKTAFDGGRTSMKDELWWKKTFDASRSSMENNIQFKTTFGGRNQSFWVNLNEYSQGADSRTNMCFHVTTELKSILKQLQTCLCIFC